MTVRYDFVKSLALHFDSIYDIREPKSTLQETTNKL